MKLAHSGTLDDVPIGDYGGKVLLTVFGEPIKEASARTPSAARGLDFDADGAVSELLRGGECVCHL